MKTNDEFLIRFPISYLRLSCFSSAYIRLELAHKIMKIIAVYQLIKHF